MRFDTLVVLIGSLAGVAAGSRAAQAQIRVDDPPAPAVIDGPGAEVAFFSGLFLVVPTVGGSVAVPVGHGLAVEGGGSVMLFANDDGERRLASHLQLRIPRRRAPGGAWESLVVGVSTFPELDDFLAGGDTRTRLRPHVASTWHWLRPRGNGLRLDVGVLADLRRPVPWPYAKVAAVVPIGAGRRQGGDR
jgi:hypothetical protein